MQKSKKAISIVIAVCLTLLIASSAYILSRMVPRDNLTHVIRDEYSLSENDELEYIGLVGAKNNVMVWYIGRTEETVIYYPVSFYAFGRRKNIYLRDEFFDPVVGGAAACQEWNGGTAYAIIDGDTEKDVPVVGYEPSTLTVTEILDISR